MRSQATWEVGHTKYVSSRASCTCPFTTGKSASDRSLIQYDKSGCVQLNTKWIQRYLRKTSLFRTLSSLDPVSSPPNHLLKINILTLFFILDSTVSRKMDHFDVSFACSFFSKSREVTNTVFWVWPTSAFTLMALS